MIDLLKENFTQPGFVAYKLLLEYSNKYPKNFFGKPEINIQHSLNVRNFSLYLQRLVGGNKEVVEVAALFHDLGKISTVEGHEDLIVKLLQKHKNDLNFSDNDFDLLLKTCSESDEALELLEYLILHCSDNLAFLFDNLYQEAYYRYVGTKKLLFEKRMDPKHQKLPLPEARVLGDAFYKNLEVYWSKRPQEAEERYRPDIEGKDLASFTEVL